MTKSARNVRRREGAQRTRRTLPGCRGGVRSPAAAMGLLSIIKKVKAKEREMRILMV